MAKRKRVWTERDQDTGYQIVGFYNPRIRRWQVFLRDPLTYVFIRGLRCLFVCVEAKFESRTQRDATKNIEVESKGCYVVLREEWQFCASAEDFEQLVQDAVARARDRAMMCFDCFGVGYAEAGVVFHAEPPEEYCIKHHPYLERPTKYAKSIAYDPTNCERVDGPHFAWKPCEAIRHEGKP